MDLVGIGSNPVVFDILLINIQDRYITITKTQNISVTHNNIEVPVEVQFKFIEHTGTTNINRLAQTIIDYSGTQSETVDNYESVEIARTKDTLATVEKFNNIANYLTKQLDNNTNNINNINNINNNNNNNNEQYPLKVKYSDLQEECFEDVMISDDIARNNPMFNSTFNAPPTDTCIYVDEESKSLSTMTGIVNMDVSHIIGTFYKPKLLDSIKCMLKECDDCGCKDTPCDSISSDTHCENDHPKLIQLKPKSSEPLHCNCCIVCGDCKRKGSVGLECKKCDICKNHVIPGTETARSFQNYWFDYYKNVEIPSIENVDNYVNTIDAHGLFQLWCWVQEKYIAMKLCNYFKNATYDELKQRIHDNNGQIYLDTFHRFQRDKAYSSIFYTDGFSGHSVEYPMVANGNESRESPPWSVHETTANIWIESLTLIAKIAASAVAVDPNAEYAAYTDMFLNVYLYLMICIHFDNFCNWGNQDLAIVKFFIPGNNGYDGKQQQATNSITTELIDTWTPHIALSM